MTLIYTIDFESLAEGATITQANSSLDADSAGANNSATATDQYAVSPNVRGAKLLFGVGGITPTNGMALQKNFPGGGTSLRHVTRIRGVSFARIDTQMDIVIPRSTVATNISRLRKLTDGRLSLMNPGGSTTLGTTTYQLIAGQKYDIQYGVRVGVSTGIVDVQICLEGNPQVLDVVTINNVALISDPMTAIRFGSNVAPSASTEWGFDSLEVHQLDTGYVQVASSVPVLYADVTNGYGLIDLSGDDVNQSSDNLTYTFTPSVNVRSTTIATEFFAPAGTYTVIGKNSSNVDSMALSVTVSSSMTSRYEILNWDETANSGAGAWV